MSYPAQTTDDVGPDARIAHILKVAKDEFLTNGFAGTTMDSIAKAAQIGKQTLYHHFHDKAELLEAVIVEDMKDFRRPPDLTREKRDLREVLFEAARWVYDNHVGRTSVSMSKILIGAASSFGALVKQHHEFRFKTSVSWIESYIGTLAENGYLAVADPHRAAVRFTLLASEGSGPIMGYEPAEREDRDRRARMAVEMFVKGLSLPA